MSKSQVGAMIFQYRSPPAGAISFGNDTPRLVASFIFYQNYASEWQTETAPMLGLKHNTNLLVE
jgi:hypothetical protein